MADPSRGAPEAQDDMTLMRKVLPFIVFALVYFAAVELSISFILPIEKVAILWIPNAIVVAFLVLSERSRWPYFIAILIPTYFLARVPGAALPFYVYAGFCVANIVEPLLIAWAVRVKVGAKLSRANLEASLKIMLLAAFPAAIIAGMIASAFLVSAKEGAAYWTVAINWIIADLFVLLTVLPALLCWSVGLPAIRILNRSLKRELTLYLLVCASVVSFFLFLAVDGTEHPSFLNQLFPYLSIPVLIWASSRFGLRVSTATMMILGSSAIMMTYFGAGPFAFEGLDTHEQVLALKLGLMSVGLIALVLAIVVSELQRTMRDLLRAKEQAELADNAKSEFLARMSHDLRTPLNSILGFSQLMKEHTFGPIGDAHYEDYAHIIHQSGERLIGLVNDILDLSRIENNEYHLSEVPLSMAQEFAASSKRCTLPVSDMRPPSFDFRVDDDAPTLFADQRAVSQILDNLVSNAIKYAGAGTKISLGWSIDAAGRGVVTVSDTGRGMSESVLENVKQPFVRGDALTTSDPFLATSQEGFGLGLHIVSRLADLHEAVVDIESAPGKGTQVSVVFPKARVLGFKQSPPAESLSA